MRAYVVDDYTYSVLDDTGRPRKPKRISQSVRREHLAGLDFATLLSTRTEMCVPAKFVGSWGIIRGLVERVTHFTDGVLIHLVPTVGGIYNADLANPHSWKRLYFWVPNQGQCGVL